MRYYSNTAVATTLENSGGITPTSTQLILGNTTGYPTQFPFTLRLEPDTPNEELVTVNSGAGSAGSPYVVSRGSDGTTAKSHAQFSPVTHGFSARDFREAQDHIADTWLHARRPLFTSQAGAPPLNTVGVWTNFTSAAWAPITFTSPPSGLIKVTIGAKMENESSGNGIALGFRVTGGKTVTPSSFNSVETDQNADVAASRTVIINNITPNVSTTVTPTWYLFSSAGTNTYIENGQLIVELLP